MDFDSDLSSLIEQIKGLFGSQRHFADPTAPSSSDPKSNVESSSGGYTAPIHGSWASSGGFTHQTSPSHPSGHMGVDMRTANGTPVFPLAAGIVTNVGLDPKGGNVVNVAHANNIKTYYAHLSAVRVRKGDKVGTDTILGLVGTSGNAKGGVPHCHFQVWKDGQIQDPANFFAVPKYTDLTPQEKAHPWISDEAKQEAMAFNMQKHLAERRVAFSKDVDKLLKTASTFFLTAQEELDEPKDMGVKIWLDDARPAPAGWIWVKKVGEAIGLLSADNVDEISLDHDLGDWIISDEGAETGDFRNGAKELTGYDVVLWMAEHNTFPPIVRVHSQNPVGRQKMEQTIDRYAPPGTRRRSFP